MLAVRNAAASLSRLQRLFNLPYFLIVREAAEGFPKMPVGNLNDSAEAVPKALRWAARFHITP
jgi:hypothetical protein